MNGMVTFRYARFASYERVDDLQALSFREIPSYGQVAAYENARFARFTSYERVGNLPARPFRQIRQV